MSTFVAFVFALAEVTITQFIAAFEARPWPLWILSIQEHTCLTFRASSLVAVQASLLLIAADALTIVQNEVADAFGACLLDLGTIDFSP